MSFADFLIFCDLKPGTTSDRARAVGMTLVLTEISRFGIAMAADSAVTITRPTEQGSVTRVLVGVRKLQAIEKLDAGISVWGGGNIDGGDSDIWLDQFIRGRQNEYHSLKDFAILLQNELRNHLPPIDAEKNPGGTIGFHLAGFVESNGRKAPTFYHIHNGRSKKLEMRGEVVDGRMVNANHDIPPEEGRMILDSGMVCVIHNGDYQIYKEVFDYLHNFFSELEEKTKGQLLLPYSASLADRVEWLRFQIATISALYNFAGLRNAAREIVKLPTIGGPITTLAISALDGHIVSYATR
jgi:hypothetical protein